MRSEDGRDSVGTDGCLQETLELCLRQEYDP
jgi:hypothetical protein